MEREQAWNLLCEFTKTEGLRKHALAVETCVAAYARKLGEDEGKWAVTALLHDFDWEIHPTLEEHPQKGEPILAERGVDEETRRAILSHASHTGVPRNSVLERVLYACDELAGFITAISYVKPHRSVHEVDVASVKKKMKDKAFARSVNRQDIVEGAQELGVPLEEHIGFLRAGDAGAGGGTGAEGQRGRLGAGPVTIGPGRPSGFRAGCVLARRMPAGMPAWQAESLLHGLALRQRESYQGIAQLDAVDFAVAAGGNHYVLAAAHARAVGHGGGGGRGGKIGVPEFAPGFGVECAEGAVHGGADKSEAGGGG